MKTENIRHVRELAFILMAIAAFVPEFLGVDLKGEFNF